MEEESPDICDSGAELPVQQPPDQPSTSAEDVLATLAMQKRELEVAIAKKEVESLQQNLDGLHTNPTPPHPLPFQKVVMSASF